MREFTKGIWEACVDGSVDIKDESGRVIDVYSGLLGQYADEREHMANARLIASAPAMYEYLVQIVNGYDLDADLEGNLTLLFKDINGGDW